MLNFCKKINADIKKTDETLRKIKAGEIKIDPETEKDLGSR